MSADQNQLPSPRKRANFGEDFRRFFMRGLAAVMPTLITLWLLSWVWNFLWDTIGQHIISFVTEAWIQLARQGRVEFHSRLQIQGYFLNPADMRTKIIGVLLSILLVYIIGVFVGNLIGRTFWRVSERLVLRVPIIRAIYPAVKQVTDFVLADRSQQFRGSRVVACQPHEDNIWSIGLVTGSAEWSLSDKGPEEMVTVFIPSTPTSISGYVLIVPRSRVVELPMTVEEAMRLLVSGGVITPEVHKMVGQLPKAAEPSVPRLGKVG